MTMPSWLSRVVVVVVVCAAPASGFCVAPTASTLDPRSGTASPRTLTPRRCPQKQHVLSTEEEADAAPKTTPHTLTESDAVRIFGRLADKTLLLDVPGAGTPELRNCCHGGCDNCERVYISVTQYISYNNTPQSHVRYSRVFDEMRAGKPKWVALYPRRTLADGRAHEAPWASVFDDDDANPDTMAAALSAASFAERLVALPFSPCMGPTRAPPPDDAGLDADAATAFFELVADGADALDADGFADGLRRLTSEAHGAPWRRFLAGVVS